MSHTPLLPSAVSSQLGEGFFKNLSTHCTSWSGHTVSVIKNHKAIFAVSSLALLSISAFALIKWYFNRPSAPSDAPQPPANPSSANNEQPSATTPTQAQGSKPDATQPPSDASSATTSTQPGSRVAETAQRFEQMASSSKAPPRPPRSQVNKEDSEKSPSPSDIKDALPATPANGAQTHTPTPTQGSRVAEAAHRFEQIASSSKAPPRPPRNQGHNEKAPTSAEPISSHPTSSQNPASVNELAAKVQQAASSADKTKKTAQRPSGRPLPTPPAQSNQQLQLIPIAEIQKKLVEDNRIAYLKKHPDQTPAQSSVAGSASPETVQEVPSSMPAAQEEAEAPVKSASSKLLTDTLSSDSGSVIFTGSPIPTFSKAELDQLILRREIPLELKHHYSQIHLERHPCINEEKPLNFEACAQGLVQIDLTAVHKEVDQSFELFIQQFEANNKELDAKILAVEERLAQEQSRAPNPSELRRDPIVLLKGLHLQALKNQLKNPQGEHQEEAQKIEKEIERIEEEKREASKSYTKHIETFKKLKILNIQNNHSDVFLEINEGLENLPLAVYQTQFLSILKKKHPTLFREPVNERLEQKISAASTQRSIYSRYEKVSRAHEQFLFHLDALRNLLQERVNNQTLFPLLPSLKENLTKHISISFSYNNQTFFAYTQTVSDNRVQIFLPNMPYQEEVEVQMTWAPAMDEECLPGLRLPTPIRKTTFQINHVRGLYQLSPQTDNPSQSHDLTSVTQGSSLVSEETRRILQRSLNISIDESDKISVENRPELNQGYIITNSSPHIHVLILQIVYGEKRSHSQEHSVTISITIEPNSTRELTQKDLNNLWLQTFIKTGKQKLSDKAVLQLGLIESLVFSTDS